MKLYALTLLAALLLQADAHVAPDPVHFLYTRAVSVEPGTASTACVTLDRHVYANSKSLADLRLWTGGNQAAGHEVPYALSTSLTAPVGDGATVLNQGLRAGRLVFDLQMPSRPYTDVMLDLSASNFVATAHVTGLKDATDKGVQLGDYTLFDLSSQRLGASTVLHLQESTFPFLHVELGFSGVAGQPFTAAADMITGATVPPSREAQTLYTLVGLTSDITQRGRQTVASLELPAHVPVERVSFAIVAGDHSNFSRTVTVKARTHTPARKDVDPADPSLSADVANPNVETVSGEISRVRLTAAGKEIRQESLFIPATLAANAEYPATVEVTIENGDDRPVPIAQVLLQMRQRRICFDVPATPVMLDYGDPALVAPVYDYARVYNTANAAREATLAPEARNASYVPRPVDQVKLTFVERYPQLLWVALLGVVAVLGFVAFRSAKKV